MKTKITVFVNRSLILGEQMRELRAQTDEWMERWREATRERVWLDDRPGVAFKLLKARREGGFVKLVYGAFVTRKEE